MTSSGTDFFQSCILLSKTRRMTCKRSSERLKLVLASSKPNAVMASSAILWSVSHATTRLSSFRGDCCSRDRHSSIQLLNMRIVGRRSRIANLVLLNETSWEVVGAYPAVNTYRTRTVLQFSRSSSGDDIRCNDLIALFGSCSCVLGFDARPSSKAMLAAMLAH
jgi:hypothetical protein